MIANLLYAILALAACVSLGLFSYNRHTREHNELAPRMVPWIMIAMGSLATSFMLVVHLVNLLGFETGNR
ncbi:MAG: hypothetical protein JKX72_09755 [Robiginitomaculum sp.]|nr:hypothetical protein [Robiginitomaculum sp.]